jgi:hypothetical protein
MKRAVGVGFIFDRVRKGYSRTFSAQAHFLSVRRLFFVRPKAAD